jgi:rsbT antagonist protein RsbS
VPQERRRELYVRGALVIPLDPGVRASDEVVHAMEQESHRVPIIRLWNLLLVPLQGELDDAIADRMGREILERIHKEACSGMIIDITGLWMVDSHLCALLSRVSNAASLMGVRTLISGMKPEIAITLEMMDIRLTGVKTTLDLERALHLLGVRGPSEERGAPERSKTPPSATVAPEGATLAKAPKEL